MCFLRSVSLENLRGMKLSQRVGESWVPATGFDLKTSIPLEFLVISRQINVFCSQIYRDLLKSEDQHFPAL